MWEIYTGESVGEYPGVVLENFPGNLYGNVGGIFRDRCLYPHAGL